MAIEELEREESNTTTDEAVRTVSGWFDKDKTAKKPFHDEWDEMWKLYNNKHWDLLDPTGKPLRTDEQKRNRPNAVENVAFSLIEGLVSEFSQDVDITDFPVESGDEEAANVMTDLKKFLAYKNRIAWEREKWLRWFFLYGTGIWHTFWDPSWRGGKGPHRWEGDIRWMAMHPRTIFPDARCRESIEEGRRVHKAFYHTVESLQEMFPDRKSAIQSQPISNDMLIGDDEEILTEENIEDQALLVETWYKGEPLFLDEGEENLGPGLHVIWWIGDGQEVYLAHANYVYFEPGEETKFPFIVKPCYMRENSVWGFGEAYFLKNPQIILNKTAEMVLEGHMHHALGQTYFNDGALTAKQKDYVQKYASIPNMWFPVNDVNGIRREFGQSIPASLQNETDRLQKVMETIVGRFDISQGKTPGSVTAFRALDLLASRAQVRLRSKEMAMTSSYEEAGSYINHLINTNYTEKRMYRILGYDSFGEEQQPKMRYGKFLANDFKKVYDFRTDEVIPLQDFSPEFIDPFTGEVTQMVEGEDYEVYSPQFDVECKVSTTLPTDRLFYMDMGKELYMAQLIDAETFWYVMEHGKFPPFEELRKKEQEKMMQGDPLAPQPQAQGGMPQGQPTGLPQGMPQGLPQDIPLPQEQGNPNEDMLNAILQQRPDLEEQLNALPPEEQQQIINQIMEGR